MSYYQALGLEREPFSNSPDPDLLYRAPSHLECLQHMEIAVRLRRGLNVVLGEVGTGKTTLGRELVRLLSDDEGIEVHFIDDPYHATPEDFLLALARLFGLDPEPLGRDAGLLREALKSELVRRGEDEGRIVVLIVDEGQKITPPCLELLRELLNFETNTHKLLQIVIFAQNEFEGMLAARPNLEDRVNFRYRLRPLNRAQTRGMIEKRLALCAPDGRAPAIFTPLALRRIYRLTRGYPRKIVRLCHLSMLQAVGSCRQRIGWGLVGRAARDQRGPVALWLRRGALVGGCALAGLLVVGLRGERWPHVRQSALTLKQKVALFMPQSSSVPAQAPAVPAAGGETPARQPVLPEANAPAAADVAGPDGFSTPAPRQPEQGQDLAAAMDLAAAALPPEASEQGKAATVQEQRPSVAPMSEAATVGSAPAQPPVASASETAAAAAQATPETPAPKIAAVVAQEQPKGDAPAPVAAAGQLGSGAVPSGYNASQLAARIYGNGGKPMLARLAAANPGKDIARLRAGETLVYPVIEAKAPPQGHFLVRAVGVKSLEEGFEFISRYKGRQIFSLFCTRQPDGSLHFDVVLPELFATRAQAEAALVGLPQDVAAQAVPVENYPAGTTYFTYLGERRRSTSAIARSGSGARQVADRQPVPFSARP
jgi:general secretion pathway protein A